MDDQTAAEKRLAKSRSQLESLDSSSSEDDDEGGSDGTPVEEDRLKNRPWLDTSLR